MNQTIRHSINLVAKVAATHADAVDQEGRFPQEALAALKDHRLLVPHRDLKGPALLEASSICVGLGRVCASSGLIYAMHLIQVACLSAMAADSKWHTDFLSRVHSDQLLLGSVTSEAGVGGDIRSSSCSLQVADDIFELHKAAPTASYAMYADALIITARRDAASASSDQVLVVVPRDMLELSETRRWNTLGMRGTCSGGYQLRARGSIAQVSVLPFSELAEEVMLPVSHVLWGSVWLGIAASAVECARGFLVGKARSAIGGAISGYTMSSALRLERAAAALRTMEARLHQAIEAISQQQADVAAGRASSLAFLVSVNGLKITLSEMALSIVSQCMQVCGTEGYSNTSQFSLGRQLRDIQSAPLMVNNDRIAMNNAQLALVQKTLAVVI